MTTQQDLIATLSGRRLTAVRIGEILGVTERTARTRLSNGLSADDLIAICRAEGVNPADTLVRLGILTRDEVIACIDPDRTLLASADSRQLVSALADHLLPTSAIAELLSRREHPRDSRPEGHPREH